ncbi:hypothetical protein EV127DRAFT_489031 [Xylaria flabelliformis]|nr:hypothetical protein EV127DRAFT_489031 [Xylaria flabelliformis]
MAASSRSAPSSAGSASAADLKQLQEEVKRLRAYKVMAEKSLAKMGVDLQAALKQGWVSKRAEVRRKRLERKKAAEAAKWAKNDQAEAIIRRERKKVGLPVRNPTPTPSEAAYLEQVAEAAREEKAERLRNRVRRMSHQLLIAAAIGHQYREVTGAVPGGAEKHKRYDARSEAGLTATEAMARSFRNWVNKAKEGARSRTPSTSTVYVSSRTTGPEDTPSGSESDSSFTDDNAAGAGIKGPRALRAIVYEPSLSDEDDIADAGEALGGLADLDLDDVSDEVLATAYGMLAKAERTDGQGDWANVLASNVLGNLIPGKPKAPSTTSWGDSETEDGKPPALSGLWGNSETETETETSGDKTELTGEGKTKTVLDFFPASPNLSNKKTQTKDVKKVSGKKKKKASNNQAPKKIPAPNPKYTAKATQTKRKQKSSTILPSPSDPNDTKGPSRRAPHKPAAPDQSVWDPTWWRVNKTDYYDGVWADKVLPKKQPTNKMETGFMLWEHQEERFPHLDDKLKLQPLYHNVIFKPEEVDTYSWDPVNRAVTEPKTGLSAPLRLGPITVHSLGRWKSAEFGGEYSRDPVQMPDSPSIEERKRSFPSAMLFKSKEEPTTKKVAFASGVKAHKVIPKPVASVHYPLKSPAATSISAGPSSGGYSGDVSSSQPETPTAVTLYEHIEDSSEEEEEEEEEEQLNVDKRMREARVRRAAAKRNAAASSSFSEVITNFNGKRPATIPTPAEAAFVSRIKKRRAATVVSVSSESEKENGEDKEEVELEIFSAAAKEFWNTQRDEPVELALSPPIPGSGSTYTAGAKKKAVRFDVSEGGPSYGMRDGARRALGRYGLTSSRRGPYR